MKIVVDTNIIFSSILNSDGLIGELLFNSSNQFSFYSPEFMIYELGKYKSKLERHTNMNLDKINISIQQVLKNIVLISPEAISDINWINAYRFTSGVDEKDTPFLATAMGIKGSLWTGDKKLIKGLKNKGFNEVYSTAELLKRINYYQ